MTAHNGNTEQDERGLLPYPVLIAAKKGDPEAMKIVVQHYDSYIASLSMRKLIDECGNTYYGHSRGHTRPFTVKAHAGCPFIQGIR